MISAQNKASATAEGTNGATQIQKEQYRFDTVIVFGQGPIRPVLLEKEVTPEQLQHWKAHLDNPFAHIEPDFSIVQQPKYLQQLLKIQQEEKITQDEKARLTELRRQELQKMGWYAMKTMGRQNALAAGYALYKGLTKTIIFTGGRTMSPWVKDVLSEDRLRAWPSEAELMKDIVLSHYGDLYEKKYGRMIDDFLLVEDAASNTLENISFVLNKYPELLEKENRIGYLSARHHLRRIKLLTKVFSLQCEEQQQLIASQELIELSQLPVVQTSDQQPSYVDEENYLDAKMQSDREERWRRGLREPEYVSYWLGYLGDVKYPSLIQKTLKRLCDDAWFGYAKDALAKVGLDFEEYKDRDLSELSRANPEKYTYLLSRLKKLKSPEHRKFPAKMATASATR